MSKHFHGQSHMKGGLDIDERTLDDNANYWKMYALGEYLKVRRILGDKNIDKKITNVSWKELFTIFEKISEKLENKNAK